MVLYGRAIAQRIKGTLGSHDREFVSSLATRIVELSPKGVVNFGGSYDEYLRSQGVALTKRATA